MMGGSRRKTPIVYLTDNLISTCVLPHVECPLFESYHIFDDESRQKNAGEKEK